MRLLVVGHPFAVAYNQKKYVALKHAKPDLALRIVSPRTVPHVFRTFPHQVHPDLTAAEALALRSAFRRWHMTYLLDPLAVARLLREFRPHVIHIEEEPQALITVEMLLLRERFAPDAAVTLFTWDNLLRPRRFPMSLLKRRLRAFSLRRIQAVACGNREAETRLREEGFFRGATSVLPQFGLDAGEHTPGIEPELRRQLGLAGNLVVGFAGRLLPEKGVLLLLEALAGLRHLPWKLLLVGSGPLGSDLLTRWKPQYGDRLVQVPAVAHAEVPRYLRAVDLFVLASYATPRWKEQFGLTVAQALLCGVPAVVSDSGALPEVVGPGGLVVAERNTVELRQALEGLLTSPALRQELAARGRAWALSQFTLEQVATGYLSVFEQARRIQPQATPMRVRASVVEPSGRA